MALKKKVHSSCGTSLTMQSISSVLGRTRHPVLLMISFITLSLHWHPQLQIHRLLMVFPTTSQQAPASPWHLAQPPSSLLADFLYLLTCPDLSCLSPNGKTLVGQEVKNIKYVQGVYTHESE